MRRAQVVLVAIFVFCLSLVVAAAVAIVINTGKGGSSTTVTTDAVDTSGSTTIIAGVSYYTPSGDSNFSDSKSNSPWVALTRRVSAGGVAGVMYYFNAPTVGSGHTFTSNNNDYPGICMIAVSGTAASAFDQQNGATGTSISTTLQPGSVTPSEDNEIVITSLAYGNNVGSISIDSGFTITDTPISTAFKTSCAYIIQTTATAVNPTWTFTAAGFGVTSEIGTFKSSGATPAVVYCRRAMLGVGC